MKVPLRQVPKSSRKGNHKTSALLWSRYNARPPRIGVCTRIREVACLLFFSISLFFISSHHAWSAPQDSVKPNEVPGVTMDENAGMNIAGAETRAQRDARMKWWRDAKFGMFIHWGIYAVPARKGEWVMLFDKIPVATYKDYAKEFNPVQFDPEKWARIASDAGMKYMVITAKHHDGFALYPSEVSDWNIAKATPYKKDVLGPLEDAARKKGMKFGLYYSQSQDWTNPGGSKHGMGHGDCWDDAQKGSYDQYLETVAVPQVRELMTRYQPDVLWFDTPVKSTTPEQVRPFLDLFKLNPGIIVNNRLGGGFKGDTETPEQFVPIIGYPCDWESCMTIGDYWGHVDNDKNLKSAESLIRKLADVCSKGGNLLLNVGPTKEGIIPAEFVSRLETIGKWIKTNGDSIYGTKAGPFNHLSWGCCTRKNDLLYLHVFSWPKDGLLHVPLTNQSVEAWLLGAPENKLKVEIQPERLVVSCPLTAPDPINTVVVLKIKGEPQTTPAVTVGAQVTASIFNHGNEPEYLFDGTKKSWRVPADVKSGSVEIVLSKPESICGFGLDQPDIWPRMKQTFQIEARQGDEWKLVFKGNSNGVGLVKDIPLVTARQFRVQVDCESGAPGIAELQLYRPE